MAITENTPIIRKRVDEWKQRLIDLSKRNQLLFFKKTKSSTLEITHPGLDGVFNRIYSGLPWKFWIPQEHTDEISDGVPHVLFAENDETGSKKGPKVDEVVCGQLEPKTLEKILKNLYRRAREEYEERGVRVLHLAFGMLNWKENENSEIIMSPLVLCPVELVRETARDPFELHLAEEELILNPALQVKLKKDFNTSLPSIPENIEEQGILGYISVLSDYVQKLGWSVEPQTALGLFSFEKLGMYNDLEKNFAHIQAHNCIQSLCGQSEAIDNSDGIVDPRNLDRIQKPVETFQILDADSSQQQCIQAVLSGKSAVLQGPPGTGKSQTISNIIAEFMARGKTVLFVSEKMAALEVVAKRLYEAGLGDFCLELHSRKANKREVTNELHKCLRSMLKPRSVPTKAEFGRLFVLRQQLNNYVSAIHEQREELGNSVFGAISKGSKYPELPAFSIRVTEIKDLSQEQFGQWSDLVRQLTSVWYVAEEVDEFPWLGCQDEIYSSEAVDRWSQVLQELIKDLSRVISAASSFATETGNDIPQNLEDISWLIQVAHHLEAGIKPNSNWLMTSELEDVINEAKRYKQLSKEYWSFNQRLKLLYEDDYFALDKALRDDIQEKWKTVARFTSNDPSGLMLLNKRERLLELLERHSQFTETCITESMLISDAFQYKQTTLTPEKSRSLARIAGICNEEYKPEADWINTKKIKEIQQLIGEVKPLHIEYAAKRNELLSVYEESLFELEIDGLIEKFQSFTYNSFVKLLNPQYHKVKKEIARHTKEFKFPPTFNDDLLKTRAVLRLQKQITTRSDEAKNSFGSYYKGYNTNFDAIEKALDYATEIVRMLDEDVVPQGILNYLREDQTISKNLVSTSILLGDRIERWKKETEELSGVINPEKIIGLNEALDHIPFEVLSRWVKDLKPSLHELCSITKSLMSHCKNPIPESFSELVAHLDDKQRMDDIQELINLEAQKLKERFGERFKGLDTTWDEVLNAIEWTSHIRELYVNRSLSPDTIKFIVSGEKPSIFSGDIRTPYEELKTNLEKLQSGFVHPNPIFGGIALKEHNNEAILNRLNNMLGRITDLEGWIDYKRVRLKFEKAGLNGFINDLESCPSRSEDLLGVFTKSFYKSQVDLLFQQDERLNDFRGRHHEQIINEFRETDRKLVECTPYIIMQNCNSRRPSLTGFSAGGSEINMLRREAAKSRRHMPIMRLFEKIPNLLLRIKPCLMMSPLSVSQFISPECFHFDLVIFDEASQIFTEDAIVAIYRGNQVVIAGDSKQMPPTNFFRSMDIGEDEFDKEETEELSSADFSSVLDECGVVLPSMMLRWHYRSKHESLIAFSNRQFYDNQLVTFPSALSKHPALGVHFEYVSDGVYDRGGKRANIREAQAVVEQILKHFQQYPNKSLGVVAFSQAQMVAIEDELEKIRIHNPQYEKFFKEDRLEGFFIKNLENVQGDERDVIIFSIGYGRDQNGKITMNFGPLNKSGGERRLNVAVTRAREKVVLVSSIRARDIDLGNTSAAGVLNLYHYLNYAENGEKALSVEHPEGLGEADSPLEDDIAGVIRQMGYQVITQVGCSGYRIDIGVLDPTNPGRFILGVECDGATYHSANTARDRDRLRQQILEKLGWRFHRIWSTDWFNRRAKEIERLKAAIEHARHQVCDSFLSVPKRTNAEERINSNAERVLLNEDEEETTKSLKGTLQYQICELPINSKCRIEFHLPECRVEQCSLLTKVVNIEGPIHIDLLSKRLAGAWNLSKVGRRIRSAVEEAVQKCMRQGNVIARGDFIWPTKLEQVPVRVPVDSIPETIRSIEYIADEEIYGAMLLILQQCIGMHPDALIVETARLFGFSKTGEKIKNRLRACLRQLGEKGGIVYTGENVTLPTPR